MIEVRSIRKSFGSLEVLKGIDLDISKGEVVSIVGPSGAGKTTLLQIMGTLDKPDSGSVRLDGVAMESLDRKEMADFRNRRIGFVFQFHQLLPEFTALENVMIPAYIGRASTSEAKARAQELLDFMGLSDRASHKPNELSGGEKQRVAGARFGQPSFRSLCRRTFGESGYEKQGRATSAVLRFTGTVRANVRHCDPR